MNDIIEKNNNNIKTLIYEIREKQVMLDSDLAKLYQVETKRINEAVRNNPDKFPERFSWTLSDEEEVDLRSKFSTSSSGIHHGGRRYHTRVFTEQGVAMLATILKSDIAIKISIQIMDAFVAMRYYIGGSISRLSNLETKVLEHDNDIKLLQSSFDEFKKKRKSHEIYFNGQIYDAYSKILEIFKDADNELVIIDSYADENILNIIKKLNSKVKIVIITGNNSGLSKLDIGKYNKQYHNLEVRYNNSFHDRYFILDNKTVYHCGTSINRIGYKTFSITQVNDDEVCKLLIKRMNQII